MFSSFIPLIPLIHRCWFWWQLSLVVVSLGIASQLLLLQGLVNKAGCHATVQVVNRSSLWA